MKQHQFTSPQPVLNEKGQPTPGWADHGLLQYNRQGIKAPFYRIKEWDWFQINTENLALQFTYGHASYAGQVGVMFFDFVKGEPLYTKDHILALPFSSMNLGQSAEEDGVIEYRKGSFYFMAETKNKNYYITCQDENFKAQIELKRLTPASLAINIPFDQSPTAFYYNHKISCMAATGTVEVGSKKYVFKENEAWGLLDWGRGVWPFHNQWYWSSASGLIDGRVFGFNLGCGFGNTSAATENALFYEGKLHKLGTVSFDHGKTYMDPWHLYDDEGRLDITLTPVYDRETKIKLLWVDNNTHQMFGPFHGTATLDDGRVLNINGLIGFAEHAVNNW